MKSIKRMLAFMLAAVMTMAMTLTAFASGGTAIANVTVKNAKDNTKVYGFKLLDVKKGVNSNVYDYTLDGVSVDIKNALKTTLSLNEDFTAEDIYNAINNQSGIDKMKVFADKFITDINDLGKATSTVQTSNEKASFENLDDGYYLFYVPNINSAVKTIIAGGENDITMKSDLPNIEKDSDVSDNGNNAGAEIGKTVNFTVTTKIPNISGSNQETYIFNLKDTLSAGLDFVTNQDGKVDVTVMVQGKGSQIVTSDLLTDNGKIMTVQLAKIVKDNQDSVGKTVTITYQAKVNKNAVIDNNNEAYIEYSNSPTTTEKTEVDKEFVPSYDLKVKKTASDKEGYLAEAVFTLRKETADGVAIRVEGQNGVYTYSTNQDTGDTNMVTVANDLGGYNLQLKGLRAGIYYLVEETAPAGYNKLKPVKILITGTPGEEGISSGGYTITVGDPGQEEVDKIVDLVNKKGTLLPETGGMGTVIFTAVALILILGVTVSFVMSRRKNKSNL